ncbi:conserved exported hypothetical protein [Burkholderia sp. 8Y]|uniref:DUF4952 domain-containing protein n=1 Tax=Burkholderia sp. 8Y TaxID=2653133 RepID=UPI0012F01B07|nr:DUF4952 domain-containing protein [Burkholderia sp. 8Y]VXC25176.1 conserved exported hypothetical protein [Burkholderia sp. 8Y]
MKWLVNAMLSCCLAVVSAGTTSHAGETSNVHAKTVQRQPSLACGNHCDERPEPPLSCGDYLKQIGRQHWKLTFLKCKPVMMDAPKIPGFEAIYRVDGSHLDEVDTWLTTWADWKRLRFSCCQWDAPEGFYRDKSGSEYIINMGADAYVNGHMIDQRKDFAKLPFAILTVTHYLYSP